jgi:hypothetical protein
MALRQLSACELAGSPTLFASFMGRAGRSYKTIGELLAIYRERSCALAAVDDPADDRRIDRFIEDMTGDRWRDDVTLRLGVFGGSTLVIDGIHRGMAYLACVQDGISPARLPLLHVSC